MAHTRRPRRSDGVRGVATRLADALKSRSATHDDLFLRETLHRCSNDLQLVVSLLALESRRTASLEAREVLADVSARVSVLAHSRAEMHRRGQVSLSGALRKVAEALTSQAEPRSILISVQAEQDVCGLTPNKISTVALAVNELATNAIKHAFEQGEGGHIRIRAQRGDGEAVVLVDDDGLPFPEPARHRDGGLGLGLVKRLVASVGGRLAMPEPGSKQFRITAPVT